MKVKNQLVITRFFRSTGVMQVINCILLLNFINLSANFYESQRIDYTNSIGAEDQIDTLSELIVEWAFEAANTTIPNDPDNQDNQNSKKIKLALGVLIPFSFSFEISQSNVLPFFDLNSWLDIPIPSPDSPPKIG